jgi:hypothetical protein
LRTLRERYSNGFSGSANLAQFFGGNVAINWLRDATYAHSTAWLLALGLNGHFGIQLKQFFQPFGVVFEAATDVDSIEHLIISIVCFTQIFGHFIGSIEIGDRGWEMALTGEQDIFGAAGEVGFVLVGFPYTCQLKDCGNELTPF